MPNKIKYPVQNGKKECGDCHLALPVELFRAVKNHYETKCKDCKKAYAANYRKRPESKERMAQYTKGYRQIPENRENLNAKTREWRKNPATKQARNTTRRKWTLNEKQKAVAYKGGKCLICSYSRCEAALDFHHLNPTEKDGLRADWTFERNKTELDKCVLLCCRCHREVHAGLVRPHELTEKAPPRAGGV